MYEIKKKTVRLWTFYTPLIIWSLIIFISSSIPGYALPDISIWSWDKWVHVAIFGLMALCALIGFESAAVYRGKSRTWVILWSLMYCVVYGASDEWHQWFVPNRSCELLDFYADLVGIGAIHALYILNLPPFVFLGKFIHGRIEPAKRTTL
jgi:hypothetical protein